MQSICCILCISLMEDVVEDSRDEGTTLKNLFLVPVLVLLVILVLQCWPLLTGLLMNKLVRIVASNSSSRSFSAIVYFSVSLPIDTYW